MKRRFPVLAACGALALIPAAPAEAHVVSEGSARLTAATAGRLWFSDLNRAGVVRQSRVGRCIRRNVHRVDCQLFVTLSKGEAHIASCSQWWVTSYRSHRDRSEDLSFYGTRCTG